MYVCTHYVPQTQHGAEDRIRTRAHNMMEVPEGDPCIYNPMSMALLVAPMSYELQSPQNELLRCCVG